MWEPEFTIGDSRVHFLRPDGNVSFFVREQEINRPELQLEKRIGFTISINHKTRSEKWSETEQYSRQTKNFTIYIVTAKKL